MAPTRLSGLRRSLRRSTPPRVIELPMMPPADNVRGGYWSGRMPGHWDHRGPGHGRHTGDILPFDRSADR